MAQILSKQANAVVTGAGSGIGRAFALAIAAKKGCVVCADIDLASAQATADHISAQGGRALAVYCDVSQLVDVELLAEQAETFFDGPTSLVINNAGVGVGGQPIGEVSMADWHWALGINLWGVVHGCHVFAPRLRAAGHGGIINVCSTASFAAAPKMGPYNVSKAAALALTETLSAEMASTGVHVTALCPTWVKTNIAAQGRISGPSAAMAQRLMARIGFTPERVVNDTLKALDRNQLYVLPQLDARLIWRSKRFTPALYTAGAGLLNRLAGNHL
ncbi:hypothetical protein DFR26_1565 [Paraperlucidibaca baekdonensis]|uniref:Short-subunit dehydrogenase n=1 Tax=Paraperlucidibaca baekdonensis TaxID=748120 RepID=A0A3E0H5P7_9GAMM|nr:SDR family NAD(P)-dependent oxidoreductase [Paraperlucidibaca baekdonensis]REH37782.1 hypothetical protein DFR26_1565 [Paraperlucidibaca baekdonensis]